MAIALAEHRARVIRLTVVAIAIILVIPQMAIAGLVADPPRWPFMLAALPHLVVLALVASSREPGGVAWGWVRGVALATLWILLAFGAIAALMVVWFVLYGISRLAFLLFLLAGRIEAIGTRIGMPGILLLVVLLVTQIVASRIAKRQRAALPPDESGSYAFNMALSLALVVAVTFVGFNVGSRLIDPLDAHGAMKEQPDRNVMTAAATIVDVQRCAHAFAATSATHAYPATLAAMGSGGANCLDSATVSGEREGSVVRYAQSLDSTLQVRHFVVMTRDRAGRAGTLAYVGDDLGNLFETKYDPPSDRGDHFDSTAHLHPVHSPVERLLALSRCISSTYASYLGEYPKDLGLDANKHHPAGRCISSPDRNSGVVTVDSGSVAGAVNFVLTYYAGPLNPDRGSPMTFALTAQPVSYGDGTIRSFLLVNDTVHVTADRRGATLTDPLVQRCELNFTYPCVTVTPDVKAKH